MLIIKYIQQVKKSTNSIFPFRTENKKVPVFVSGRKLKKL